MSTCRFYGLLKEFLEEGRTSGESLRRGSTWMSEKMRKAVLWLQRKFELKQRNGTCFYVDEHKVIGTLRYADGKGDGNGKGRWNVTSLPSASLIRRGKL